MSAQFDPHALSAHLALVMFIGSARAEATLDQRSRLAAEVKPLLGTFRADGDPKPLLLKVIEIMGPEWEPSGEWKAWIDSLLSGGAR